MKIYNLPSQTPMSGFYIAYYTSLIKDKKQHRGITHLIEHLIFKHIKHFFEIFDQLAIDYNAITTDDYVVFYIAGLDKYINQYKDRFFKQITKKHRWDIEEVEEEKKVVMQEYCDYFSYNSAAIKANGLRKYYDYYGAIGQKSSIENVTIDTLLSLYEQRFSCPYMIIDISNISFLSSQLNCVFDKEIEEEVNTLSFLDSNDAEYEPIQPNQTLIFGFKNFISNKDLSHSQLLNYLLCGSVRAPIMNRLRAELNLCYNASLYEKIIGDKHITIFETNVNNDYKNIVVDNVTQILNNLADNITYEMFIKAVEHFKIKREMQMIGRHNNITDIFYPNLMRKNQLEDISYKSILEHGEKYYCDFEHIFILYE